MATEIFTHSHAVIDADREFVIDPITMQITSGTNKLTLPQHSKNAERLTFLLPDKMIEGHDMTTANQVLIHYRNISQNANETTLGVYTVTDLKETADGAVTLSWLIGEDATRYAGGLIFSIHFGCVAENGTTLYNLPTLTNSEITIGATVWNSETIANNYPDIIAEFDARIAALEAGGGNMGGAGTVTSVNGVQPDENGNVQIETGVTPEEVLEALPAVTAVDFSAFDRGSFTETVDGEAVTHAVTFDEQGRPTTIDDIAITWGDAL